MILTYLMMILTVHLDLPIDDFNCNTVYLPNDDFDCVDNSWLVRERPE